MLKLLKVAEKRCSVQTEGLQKEISALQYAQGGMQAEVQMWQERNRALEEQISALQDSQSTMLDAQDVLRVSRTQLQLRCNS